MSLLAVRHTKKAATNAAIDMSAKPTASNYPVGSLEAGWLIRGSTAE
jgi:hypothetical protein